MLLTEMLIRKSYRQGGHVQIDSSHRSLELVHTGGGSRSGSSGNHLDGFDVDTNFLDLLVIRVTVGGGVERLLLRLVEIRPGIVRIVVDGGGWLLVLVDPPGVPESLLIILVWSWCFTPPSLLPITADIFLFRFPLRLQRVFGFCRLLPVLLLPVLQKSWKENRDKVEVPGWL